MRNSDTPIVKDLVLLGGGHSHVSVMKRFGMKPMPGVRVTVISRDVHAPYSGMLPGLISGHYSFDDVHIDLRRLAQFAKARFYHNTVTGIDLENKQVLCANRPPVPYDVLSINTGATPRMHDVPGSEQSTVPVKPIDRFAAAWQLLHDRVIAGEGQIKIGVVGGGAGGVEILLAMRHSLYEDMRLLGRDPECLTFFLITQTSEILPSHNPKVRNKFRRAMEEGGVHILTGETVVRVDDRKLITDCGTEITLDEILWVTAAGAAEWPGRSGLAIDKDGFIRVHDTLQSVSHPDVFAAGDIASVDNHPRPKSGVFAVRQGRPLSNNLRRALVSKKLKPFKPQRKFLSLVTTGNQYAIASWGNWALEGAHIWRWKDWIDRRFIDKFTKLPEMADEKGISISTGLACPAVIAELSNAAMRCGGCGAKVGADVLHDALRQLTPHPRDDVLVGLGDPDDAAIVEVPPGKVMVHSVDGFRAFVDDPYLFGKITANHCLGDIYAMGAEPQTALALATLPFGIDNKVRDDLVQMLSGALEVLGKAGASLVGGHTAEGSELALGFAVNGLADRAQVLRKRGAKSGERLILTKPLGTGTLLAANMRGKAPGHWIDLVLSSMAQSNQQAAVVLRAHGATAATDVTGFGLAGHLIEMLSPSGMTAEVNLNALPVFDGAQETSAVGLLSSLHSKNQNIMFSVKTCDTTSDHPKLPLLFDPQTAGGLLASVPAEHADTCLEKLRAAGYDAAAIIGSIIPMAHDGYSLHLQSGD
ncbi:MAG TPA: selenide, water dikinase SelD [Sneathiellales bacterium]|nr:selenide, water dikinase SelD [Sneathiellales bacterium]